MSFPQCGVVLKWEVAVVAGRSADARAVAATKRGRGGNGREESVKDVLNR
jgi:hypothetical protein